jgi:uncharacterized protein (TIGR00299 family) protein
MHIHLDPIGGIAGDMFIAALLHAFPEHVDAVIEAATTLTPLTATLTPHTGQSLAGARFTVEAPSHHHHHHAHWADIRAAIAAAPLPAPVRATARAIFTDLAEAESRIHGIPADGIAFHEVGAADSIADIIGAAMLIHLLGPASWSISPIPAGSGRVQTAHGILPLPAPATALLLEGLPVHDDGIEGERVTPTGAAILRHLRPATMRPPGTIARQGFGFGTRTLPGLPNCLRALILETASAAADATHRELLVVTFEVDDQSPEDLAAGLAQLRATPGIHDALQLSAVGKKSRLTTQIQVLAAPGQTETVIAACFTHTTTIGLRTQMVQARALPRRIEEVYVDGTPIRVKITDRPGGPTRKAEADDLAHAPSHAARTLLRRRAESPADV